jgi:hypothetical protein
MITTTTIIMTMAIITGMIIITITTDMITGTITIPIRMPIIRSVPGA